MAPHVHCTGRQPMTVWLPRTSMQRFALIAILSALISASPLAAQDTGSDKVPAGHRPPPGMCRIWIDGVPPGQQAAPTDCATAIRNRPANGRVVFGDEYAEKKSRKSKLIPSGIFGGKDDNKTPVKKLREDGSTVAPPKAAAPTDSVAQKKDSKKSSKTKAKKPADKTII